MKQYTKPKIQKVEAYQIIRRYLAASIVNSEQYELAGFLLRFKK